MILDGASGLAALSWGAMGLPDLSGGTAGLLALSRGEAELPAWVVPIKIQPEVSGELVSDDLET